MPSILLPRLAAITPHTIPTGADTKITRKEKAPITEIGTMTMLMIPNRSFFLVSSISIVPMVMVQGEGFEPPKAEPDDLQSPVFDRFTIPAVLKNLAWSRQRDSNPRPAVYKTAALATELCRH